MQDINSLKEKPVEVFDEGYISIYIHWPFCIKKCPYCDFNSHVSNDVDHKKWHKAYFNAFARQSKFFSGKKIKSIFFGGGTPSLMDPQVVFDIIDYFSKQSGEKITEITLESNPSTFEINRFKEFKDAGINRLSTGIQSFFDSSLLFLGRNHNSKEAILALEASNKIFDRTSFDLIIGLPNQSLDMLKEELKMAMSFFKEHISIYQLTIEEGTLFYKQKVKEMSDDISSVFFECILDTFAKFGINQYEISNFSLPTKESIHNLNYWQGGEYLGFGPNAQGRFFYEGMWRGTREIKNPKKWLETSLLDLDSQKNLWQNPLWEDYEVISANERFLEVVMTSLRVAKPLRKDIARQLNVDKVNFLRDEELLDVNQEGLITTTRKGKMCLNYVIKTLLI